MSDSGFLGRVVTYMPEFPPVTMNTFPLRSGRVSGWNVMFKTVLGSICESEMLRKRRYNASDCVICF
jgi:hypothetical protein